MEHDALTPELVEAFDDGQLAAYLKLLNDEQSRRYDARFVAAVKAQLAQMDGMTGAVKVTFGTSDWDNGYFLDDSGIVYFADGTSVKHVYFDGREFDEAKANVGGGFSMGSGFRLEVDLTIGTVDGDTYGEE